MRRLHSRRWFGRRLGLEIGATLATNIAVLGASAARTAVLARALPLAEYAMMSLIILTVNTSSQLLLFGLDSFIAARLPRDAQERARTLLPITVIVIAATVVAVAVGSIFAFVDMLPVSARMFWLGSVGLLCTVAGLIAIQCSYRDGRIIKYNLLILIKNAGWLLLILTWTLWRPLTLDGVIGLWVFCLLATAVVGVVGVPMWSTGAGANWASLVGALRYSLPLYPMLVGSMVLTSIDRYLLAYYWPLETVALYTIGFMVIEYTNTAIVGVSTGVFPRFAAAWERREDSDGGEWKNLRDLSLVASLMVYFPAALVLFIWGDIVVVWLAGAAYAASADIVRMLMILPVLKTGVVIMNQELMVKAKTWLILKAQVVGIGLTVATSIILIPWLGIYGLVASNVLGAAVLYTVTRMLLRADSYRAGEDPSICDVATTSIGMPIVIGTAATLVMQYFAGRHLAGVAGLLVYGCVLHRSGTLDRALARL